MSPMIERLAGIPEGKDWRWRLWLGCILTLVILLGAAWAWDQLRPAPFVPATVAPEVAQIAPEPVAIKNGKVKALPGAKKKLKLDAARTEEVLTASRVPDDGRAHTVVTLVDTETGDARAVVRAEPLPLFAINTHGRAVVGAVMLGGQPAVMAQVQQGLVQVKAVKAGLVGGIIQPIGSIQGPVTYLGLGAWAEW